MLAREIVVQSYTGPTPYVGVTPGFPDCYMGKSCCSIMELKWVSILRQRPQLSNVN